MANVTTPASRRVLGAKSTNFPLSTHRNNVKTIKASSIQSQVSPHEMEQISHTESPKTGEKRRRDDLDERDDEREQSKTESSLRTTRASRRNHLSSSNAENQLVNSSQSSGALSQPLSLLSDMDPISPTRAVEESTESSSTSHMDSIVSSRATTSTAQSSFESSQAVTIEEQFEIAEEMSQNALDKIHAVKLSHSQQHTSQMVPPIRPSLIAEASQESFGLSSFIEYEKDEIKKQDDKGETEMLEPVSKGDGLKPIKLCSPRSGTVEINRHSLFEAEEEVTNTVEVSKPSMTEAAQLLRDRLQLALFKVQTHQTRTPFSRLRVPVMKPLSLPQTRVQAVRERSSSPDLPPVQFTQPVDSSSRSWSVTPPTANYANSPESKLAAARARINNIRKPRIKSLGSLPLPKLAPGPFSAKYAELSEGEQTTGDKFEDSTTETKTDGGMDFDERRRIPSSPPVCPSSSGHKSAQALASPDLGAHSPTTPAAETVVPRLGLTSSVVKGEAANGLLNLSRSFEEA